MPQDFLPANDADYATWVANFNTVANVNLVALGLVIADLTPSVTNLTTLNTTIATFITAQAAAKAATQGKATARKNSEVIVRTLSKRIQANPAVTNALKGQLGLPIRDTPSGPVPPMTPIDLFVNGSDTGINSLSWKGNGNKQGVTYIIEAKIGTATGYLMVDTTTKTKYQHTGQTPGVRAQYRVRAKRADLSSAPSNEAVVYG